MQLKTGQARPQNRRNNSGPVFLRAFADHERAFVTQLFTNAANSERTPSAITSAVRSECQRISLNETDFYVRTIANKTLGRIDSMPAFAFSFASHIADEQIGGANR